MFFIERMLCDPFHAFDTAIIDKMKSLFCRFYLLSAHWVMNSLKTRSEIQRPSKEMIEELIRHQGDFTEVKALISNKNKNIRISQWWQNPDTRY